MNENTFPTEVIELPSKGLVYPPDSPLRSGKVDMKYMGASEEDILSNQNFIEKGIAFDKFLSSMILNKFPIKSLVPGDKEALFVASRILGYGKDYSFKYKGEDYSIDLTTIENKEFDASILTPEGYGKFKLPNTNNEVTFKFLTEADLDEIEEEIKNVSEKLKIEVKPITTKLRYTIVSVNGNSDKNHIKSFIENGGLLAPDSRALRKFISEVEPGVNLKFKTKSNEEVAVPIGLSFFWPDI